MEHTFSTPAPVSLVVELRAGDLLVTTAETAETVVDVSGDRAEDVVVEQHGDEVRVLARSAWAGLLGSSEGATVRISAPHDSGLSTKLGSARTSVEGRLGPSHLRSGSGDLRVRELGAAATVATGSGDVSVERVGGPLRLTSGSGDVVLRAVEAPVRATSGSGDVQVGDVRGPVEVKSGSGDLRVADCHEDVRLSTASGDLDVDRLHRGQLSAQAVSGDIRVGVVAGVPVWTDVSTTSGTVRSTLAGAGRPEDGQDHIELRARTVSGDVVLAQL